MNSYDCALLASLGVTVSAGMTSLSFEDKSSYRSSLISTATSVASSVTEDISENVNADEKTKTQVATSKYIESMSKEDLITLRQQIIDELDKRENKIK